MKYNQCYIASLEPIRIFTISKRGLSQTHSQIGQGFRARVGAGALNSISNSSYRLTAAQVGATEAYHASLIRTLLFQVIDVTPAYGLTVRQITEGITQATNTLAQEPQIKYALSNQQGSSVSNVDSNGEQATPSSRSHLHMIPAQLFYPSGYN